MRASLIRGSVNCGVFRSFVCHFQAGELAEEDRTQLHEHMDRCPPCAQYLAVEQAFIATLQTRIPRRDAPEGLESRVRSALIQHCDTPHAAEPWFSRRSTWALAAAAAAVVAFATWAIPRGAPAGPAAPIHVVRPALLVDEDCDRAGYSIEVQRDCRTTSHLNAWKLDDGTYWSLSVEDPMARTLVADAAQRGRRFVVEGDFYPTIRTIHLTRMPAAEASWAPVLRDPGAIASLR